MVRPPRPDLDSACADIFPDNRVVVFKNDSDVMMYVVGSADENEVLLYNVLLCLRDSLSLLLK